MTSARGPATRGPGFTLDRTRAALLAPENDQIGISWVIARVATGRGDEATADARRILAANPRWPTWLRRMADRGMLPGGNEAADWLDQLG